MFECIYMYIYVKVYICINVFMYTCIYVYMYICMDPLKHLDSSDCPVDYGNQHMATLLESLGTGVPLFFYFRRLN